MALSLGMTSNTDYLYRFTAIGNVLTASIFKLDTDGNFTIKLGEVSVEDDSYTSGYYGFRNFPGADTRATYFSDLAIISVPEPSNVAFLAIALIALPLKSHSPLPINR